MDNWGTFTTVAGDAAAALLGLLFVAVSIRIDVIGRSQELRNRATQTMALFVTALLIAILLSIPGQSYRELGGELIALALVTTAVLLYLDRRAAADPVAGDDGAHRLAALLEAVAPNGITALLLFVAGALLVFRVHAGLDVLVVPVLAALAGGVVSAWLLMTKIPDETQPDPAGEDRSRRR